jgi:hypothetical protein
VGFVVGAYWGNWGYCNWPYRRVYVNHHYYGRPYPGYRSAHVGSVVASRGAPSMQKWRHDPYHRRGVAYRDAAVGNQFGQARRTTADNRRVSRTFENNMARRTAATKADAATRTGIPTNVGRTTDRSYPLTGGRGRPEASVSRTRPDRAGANRVIGSHSEGETSPTIERSGRIETSSIPRNVTEQRGSGGRTTERAYHPPSAQGGAPAAPAGVNRGVTIPTPVDRGRDESVSAPKAQNWNGVVGGQRSVGSAGSRGGAVGAGGAFSRGGTGSHVGGGMGGGRSHRGR